MPASFTDETWPIDRLRAYANNSRVHSPEQIAQIVASITEWGFTVRILADDTGMVIAGHGRLQAARQMGMTEVPVRVAHGWTEAQKRAYVIADNRLTEEGKWDEAMLRIELGALLADDFDLDLTGMTDDDLSRMSIGIEALEAMPTLPDGDRSQFRQMDFILLDHQAVVVAEAVRIAAQGLSADSNTGSKNKNGNALAAVCQEYLDARPHDDPQTGV